MPRRKRETAPSGPSRQSLVMCHDLVRFRRDVMGHEPLDVAQQPPRDPEEAHADGCHVEVHHRGHLGRTGDEPRGHPGQRDGAAHAGHAGQHGQGHAAPVDVEDRERLPQRVAPQAVPPGPGTGGGGRRAHAGACVRAAEEIAEYWRDVGTLDAYFEANLDLTDVVPKLNLYDRDWPIWTDQVVAAPAKFVHDEEGRRGMAVSSLISQDCIVSGALAHRSLLFTGVKMGSFSSVEAGVILPYCNIGRGARLKRVILDSGVRIPEGLVVGEDPELDARRFRRSEKGVCLITKKMIEQLDL